MSIDTCKSSRKVSSHVIVHIKRITIKPRGADSHIVFIAIVIIV